MGKLSTIVRDWRDSMNPLLEDFKSLYGQSWRVLFFGILLFVSSRLSFVWLKGDTFNTEVLKGLMLEATALIMGGVVVFAFMVARAVLTTPTRNRVKGLIAGVESARSTLVPEIDRLKSENESLRKRLL